MSEVVDALNALFAYIDQGDLHGESFESVYENARAAIPIAEAMEEVVRRAVELRAWAGCVTHFPEGCPDDCAESNAIAAFDDALDSYKAVKR
jgi:hypothetical protein